MSFDRKKQLSDKEIESMKIAVNETDIKAIHPDKMEDFAEYMVQSLKSSEIVDDYANKLMDPPTRKRGGKLSDWPVRLVSHGVALTPFFVYIRWVEGRPDTTHREVDSKRDRQTDPHLSHTNWAR